jgi:hypothetical protein
MRKNPTNLLRQLLLLVASATLSSCAGFGADGDAYQKLERLRVLAVRSDPADLNFGETATLSANVYEPASHELSYAWSWCPSRADSSGAFECNLSEQDLQRVWTAAGLDSSPPIYTLGTDPEVELTNVLAPSVVTALCQSRTGDASLDERLALACFKGLEASIEFTVRSSEAEITAIKSVPLLMGETPASERNKNPISNFDVTLRDEAGGIVASDQPLQVGHRYIATADVDVSNAESFVPRASIGEPSPGARRETMVMSWFVTVGELFAPDGTHAIGGDNEPTTFVDGSNDFKNLLENGWKIPLTAGANAELRLVLRDERGGVGWTTRSFAVVGGEK